MKKMNLLDWTIGILFGYCIGILITVFLIKYQAFYSVYQFLNNHWYIILVPFLLTHITSNKILLEVICPLLKGIFLAILLKNLLGDSTLPITIGAMVVLFVTGLLNPNASDDIMGL